MNDASPLVFRASAAHRAVTVSLALGCLLVSVRGGFSVVQDAPKMLEQLKLAHSLGEPTTAIWLSLTASLLAILVAGTVSVLSVLVLALVEGTQILVDECGISVDCPLLPRPLARMLGAGRIPWESVSSVGRRWMRFVVTGNAVANGSKGCHSVGFLFVDQLERLMFIIMERSPNLKG
jgi:hypothetical protein